VLEASALGASGYSKREGALDSRVEVVLSKAFAVGVQGGVFLKSDGFTVRDLNLTGVWRVLQTPSAQITLRPGLNLPTGGLGGGLSFTPTSTSSVDPTLGAEAVVGGRYVLAASAHVRVPLYKGYDTVRQGVYIQTDLRGAVPLFNSVVWAGMSYVKTTSADNNLGRFHEVAATAGGVWTFHERASLNLALRVPLEQGPINGYRVAGMTGVTWVVGKRPRG
jgi:hypothetical protein